MTHARLLAIDWGTSSLRGALLNADGRVLDERRSDQGILAVPSGAFGAAFEHAFGDWARSGVPLGLIAGMAGSRQGWLEAPYAPCPAGFEAVAAHLAWIDEPGLPLPLAIVPGLSCTHADAVLGAPGMPDVMRGEETQVLGALRLAGLDHGMFVLPGTHSKWVEVEHGRIVRFQTSMTGELYALLSRHSLLARTLKAEAVFDPAAFLEGVQRARAHGDLLHQLFSVRTLALFERRTPEALASHLSGLLVGTELRSREPLPASVVLIGSPSLLQPYGLALAACGVHTQMFDNQACWAGLHAIAAATPRRGREPLP